jgi:hypothetical protein
MLDILSGKNREIFRKYYVCCLTKTDIMAELDIEEQELNRALNTISAALRRRMTKQKCKICKKQYYTPNTNSTLCDKCKSNGKGKEEQVEPQKEQKSKKKKKVKSVYEILRSMEKYNAEHHTNLSYGYYVYITGE